MRVESTSNLIGVKIQRVRGENEKSKKATR
jgi:hypothetical protein